MQGGLNNSKADGQPSSSPNPEVIVVNVSVSGSRLGGAAIAAEWHSRFLSELINIELWRMWDNNSISLHDSLLIRNFKAYLPLQLLSGSLPRRAQAILMKSDILPQIFQAQPRIVHLQNPSPALEFERIAKVCQQNGIIVVASTHGFYEVFNPNYDWKWYEEFGWRKWMTSPIERSLKYVDALLSGYPAEKQILLERGVPSHKIHLVPNGINPYFEKSPASDESQQVLEKFNIPQDRPILLFMGNHTSNKGIDTVLEVAANLSLRATVVIGGKLLSPDEPEQRLSQMPSMRLTNIVFTDYLTESEQRALYYAATLLLFPSFADTLPLTILEAMACGLPVVAYDTGGISYQLADDSGVLVPQGNSQAFIDVVQRLLVNLDDRQVIKTNAKRRQRQMFSWKLAAQKTIQVYDSLLLSAI